MRLRTGGVEVAVRLNTKASREGVQGVYGDRIKIGVNAPPVAGAANQALVRLLAKAARRPPSEVKIVLGLTSRSKTVLVNTPDPGSTAKRILGALAVRSH